MIRPKRKIVPVVVNSMTLVGLLTIIPSLVGFISLPQKKAAPINVGSQNEGANIDKVIKKVVELNDQKKHKDAIELLMSAIESKGDEQLFRVLLLQTFDMFLQDEIRLGQSAVKSDPNDVEAYARVSSALELMGDEFRAMEVLLNGISRNQDATALWMKVAKLELAAKREMEAVDIFKEVVRLDPKNSDAYNNAAFILSQAQNCNDKDLVLAENFAKNARTLDPKNPEYIDTLAEVQFRLGNQKLAHSLILEAIRLAPNKQPFEIKLKKFSSEQSIIP